MSPADPWFLPENDPASEITDAEWASLIERNHRLELESAFAADLSADVAA